MRRLLVGSAAGILLAASLAGLVSAAPGQDKVTGNARVEGQFGAAMDFGLSAHSGPAGEDAHGNLNYRNVDYPDGRNGTVEVSCLEVRGDEAIIVGRFKGEPSRWAFGPDYPFAVVYVRDNGQPNGASPDVGFASGWNEIDPTTYCRSEDVWGYAGFAQPLLHGNVVVNDAT